MLIYEMIRNKTVIREISINLCCLGCFEELENGELGRINLYGSISHDNDKCFREALAKDQTYYSQFTEAELII
jgi:hypothetical protein